MEIFKKIIDLLFKIFRLFEDKKVEEQEVTRVNIEQTNKTQAAVTKRKPRTVQKPKKDDFFSDEDSW